MEADPQTIGMIASSVVDNLPDDGGTGSSLLSLAEIQVVVRRAVTRTEMYGISVANIAKAIMDYVTGEGHANQKQVEQMIKDSRNTENAKSPVTNMMQAFAGAFLRNNKINK
jgi:Holliday junction resolvasome RuvABC endonuclease subunit